MRGFCLEVSGPYACFTRPEMKVERVSYDVITPSAARAIFDAILWKPAIFWQIKRIEVLEPIKWISVRRNEVGKVSSPRVPFIFIEDERQQRAGLFLRDVKYRLHAEFVFIPPDQRGRIFNPMPEYLIDRNEATELRKPDERMDETEAKYAAMFERRARKGQCFNQPYLGCREFSCNFQLIDPRTNPAIPIAKTRDLGWMLYDMDFSNPSNPKPQFFHASIENGVIDLCNVEVRS
jgi:CRISPR-associated protein Cas5d